MGAILKLRDAASTAADKPTPQRESSAERHERLRSASLYCIPWCGDEIHRSRAFIYQEIDKGRLRAVKMCGVKRIERQEWERWLQENVK